MSNLWSTGPANPGASGIGAPLPQDDYNPFTAALKTYGWSLGPGLIGLESKDPSIERFKTENPISSFATEMAGYATPYLGWAKWANKIPGMGKIIESVASKEAIEQSPFTRGALKEIVTFAPLEATRIASNAFMGNYLADKLDAYNLGVSDVSKTALANLAIGGAVGGAFQKLLGGGGGILKQRRLPAYPGLDMNEPPQMQLRKLREMIEAGQTPDPALAQAGINTLRTRILDETPLQVTDLAGKQESQRAVKSLISSKIGERTEGTLKEHGRQLSRFFKMREGVDKGLEVSRIKPDILGQDAYQKVLTHLPANFEDAIQFPRLVRANSDKTAASMQEHLVKRMDPADGSMAGYAREGHDGLYVIAKKIEGAEEAKAGDKWLLFKTDQPGKFFPDREEWQKTLVQRNAWLQDTLDARPFVKSGLPVWDDVLSLKNSLRAEDYRGMEFEKGNIGKTIERLMKKTGVDPANTLAYQRMAKFANDYLTPTMTQFTKSPLARQVWAEAKMAYDKGRQMADEIFFGQTHVEADSPLKLFLGSDVGKGLKFDPSAIDKAIDELYKDPDAVVKVHQIIRGNYSIDEALQKFDIGKKELDVLKGLDAADNFTTKIEKQIEDLVGLKLSKRFQELPNHYLISNTWRGTLRTPVWTENKRLLGVGAGNDARESYNAAVRIKEYAESQGLKVNLGETVAAGELDADRALRHAIAAANKDPRMQGIYRRMQGRLPDPQTYNERTGVGGFIGEDRPWTKQEVKDIAHGHLQDRWRRIANLTFEAQTKRQRALLMGNDPESFELLHRRISQLEGHQGPVSKLTNDIADKVLAPFLGKNSASRIVAAANKAMFGLELGFMNTSYALANALTFMQTSLPIASFVTSAVPERVAQYFTFFPVQGAKAAGHVGVLDIMKLTGKSFKDMVKPSEELQGLLTRGVREGVTDPKFVEDAIGENSRAALNIRSALEGKDGFVNFIKSISGLMPGASEKLSRGHSFILGYNLGKLFNMEGEGLYQFAKEFTEKSMFLYSAADRPLVITGPFGSAFGLFKNWLMHYMNWGLTFAGEGVKYGNWKPLMTMVAGTSAIGGLPALVGWGGLDALQKTFTDQNMMQNIYQTFGGDKEHIGLGDGVYYGLPGLLGFSLQNTVSMPFADPARDASFLFGLAYWDRMKAFGKMAGDAYDQLVASGRHPGEDPHVLDSFIRAFAPKAIVRAASIDFGNSDAIHSLSTGYPTIDKLGPAQKLLYTIGVNPRQIEMGYEISNELWKDQEKKLAVVQAMGKEWADATQAKDYTKLKEINYRAVTQNVNIGSVLKSANSRLAKGREALIDRQFSPEAVYAYRRLGLY